MLNSRFVKGFTLIEILVVISIIGILSAILYASFGEARTDSKNKALRVEMKEVQLALELYKAQNGQYPSAYANASDAAGCTENMGLSPNNRFIAKDAAGCTSNSIIVGLVGDFVSELPSYKDSENSNCSIVYTVAPDNSWYSLMAERCVSGQVSATDGVQSDDELARCLSSCSNLGSCVQTTANFYETYAVFSPGGECNK